MRMRRCEKLVAGTNKHPCFMVFAECPIYRAQGLAGGSLCLGLGMIRDVIVEVPPKPTTGDAGRRGIRNSALSVFPGVCAA
jgi:hypothetical protein